MNPMTPVQKLSATASGAIVAGILGVMLTAFGNAISGAPLGIWATIILAVALGAWFGRLAGAIAGATCGALLVALGALVGGSTLGIVLTIASSVFLGGWLSWVGEWRVETPAAAQEMNDETYEKEMLLWT